MTIETSGPTQNSYISLSEANALLLTMTASFFQVGAVLDSDDAPYLCEAFRDLERLWDWAGQPSDAAQSAQWPRKYVNKPGWQVPAEPGWNGRYCDPMEWIAYQQRYLSGGSAAGTFIPSETVPQDIKEAQALIAMLRKSGGNLVGDNQGDLQGTQLGKIKISYVNAIRESADIHKRTGHFGRFKAGLLTGA